MQRDERYMLQGGERLRMGYTTGSCAAAAARAAAVLLLRGQPVEAVEIQLPGGEALCLEVVEHALFEDSARCAVIKDAGDDPDVTDGAQIGCTVSRIPAGFAVEGGAGVGRVTRPGLPCAVGGPAINPVPRAMIEAQLAEAAADCGYAGGLRAVVDVPKGAALAGKTFNPRLGIEGGISILGTSGLVEPMSGRAVVGTIRAEIDLLAASGAGALLIVPGNYGAAFAQERFGLSLERGVRCANFVGEALDYAVYRGFRRILLLGHAGKLTKLAAGIMDTHSRTADGRSEILAAHAGLCGLAQREIAAIFDCGTVDAADGLLRDFGAAQAVWASIGARVGEQLARRCGGEVEIAFAAFLPRGVVMQAGGVERMIEAYFTDRKGG